MINRLNQVWYSDMTDILMRKGSIYLATIIDWSNRKMLWWRLSNTMDAEFYIEALQETLIRSSVPEIFNTNKGSQFTMPRFMEVME